MSTKEKSGEPFVIERVFDAPAALVWRAITNKEDMKRWYFDLKEFKPEVGFQFEFAVDHEGTRYDHRCRVTEVVPGRKIAYTWRYEGQPGESVVTFELFPEGKRTRLKLTHEGLDSFPKLPAYARSNFEKGWTELIDRSLREFLETGGGAGANEIVVTRVFFAPRELVWEAMTDPRHVANWWGPRGFSTTIETMEVRPGGTWKHVMRGPDGKNYPNQSVFREVVKPERIVYSHGGGREGGPGAHFTATWTFEEVEPGKTRLTARMVFTTPEERDFVVKEFGAIEGGKQTLERLSEHVPEMTIKPFLISRTFDAPRDLVWKAWSERDRMMQWFGPKGFKMTAAKLDFRPGGMFHYCLKTPDGREMWGKFAYREIVPQDRILWVNSFSDAEGGLTRHPFSPLPWPLQMLSEATFAESGGKTTITVKWIPYEATAEEIKTFEDARPGMTQGWAGTFEQLTDYLARGA